MQSCSLTDFNELTDFSFYISALFSFHSKLVKFLVFAPESSDLASPCGLKGNCSAPTLLPFLPKNPGNQTGINTTGDKSILLNCVLGSFTNRSKSS